MKNRNVSFFFHQSWETVSRHFHNVLNVVFMLEKEFLIEPSGSDMHPCDLINNRFILTFR